MLWLPINLIRHSLPLWLAELPTLRRGRPQQVSFVRVITSRRQAEFICLNWESKQRSPGELASLGLPYWEDPPTHWHSPGGEPGGEGATCQPTMSHHLFSHTSWPGGHPLFLNYTRHPPAVLDFISLRFKVDNIKSWKDLGLTMLKVWKVKKTNYIRS